MLNACYRLTSSDFLIIGRWQSTSYSHSGLGLQTVKVQWSSDWSFGKFRPEIIPWKSGTDIKGNTFFFVFHSSCIFFHSVWNKVTVVCMHFCYKDIIHPITLSARLYSRNSSKHRKHIVCTLLLLGQQDSCPNRSCVALIVVTIFDH